MSQHQHWMTDCLEGASLKRGERRDATLHPELVAGPKTQDALRRGTADPQFPVILPSQAFAALRLS